MNNRKRRAFGILPRFWLYLALLLFSVVFTQLLRNPISSVLLVSLVFLPILSLLYVLIGRNSIRVYVICEKTHAEKGEPFEYEIRIANDSVFPFPFVDAFLREAEGEVRCRTARTCISMTPFGSYSIKRKIGFRYRGFYEIGVEEILVSDPLRLFFFRSEAHSFAGITVSPRITEVRERAAEPLSDFPSVRRSPFDPGEKVEAGDIKDYEPGDPIKDIHWKLSSKTDDIKVKLYSPGEKRQVFILADLARAEKYREKEPDEVSKLLKDSLKAGRKKRKEKERFDAVTAALTARAIKEVGEDEKDGFFTRLRKKRLVRRRIRQYKKRIAAGVSENKAELIKTVDTLIDEAPKKGRRVRPEKKEISVSPDQIRPAFDADDDLQKLIEGFDEPLTETGSDIDAFGGRIRPEAEEDYDEYSADVVCEFSIALARKEAAKGNSCSVMWFDSRYDGGVAVFDPTVGSFSDLSARLSGAPLAESDKKVSALAQFIRTQDADVKIVTANIDPVSRGSLEGLSSVFGGDTNGGGATAFLFSLSDRYGSPSKREAYCDETASELSKRGVRTVKIAEMTDVTGRTYYEVSDR